MKTIAFFNNKGGVGKTTLVYHLAWMLADNGIKTLAVDLDPQANLTAMFLDESRLEALWPDDDHPETIYGCISPILDGIGDIADPHLERIYAKRSELFLGLVPGDLGLSRFEDKLSDAWPRCHNKDASAFRTMTAFHRLIEKAGAWGAEVALIDVGPNLGAINRSALIACDLVVLPLAPDLFSLQGLKNLGPTLQEWREIWSQLGGKAPHGLSLPRGSISPAGYVVMQHGIRDSRPVKAYQRWMEKIPDVYRQAVLDKPSKRPPVVTKDPYCFALLKHYRSLMPFGIEARKPMFFLKPADGAIGAHVEAVRSCYKDFRALAQKVAAAAGLAMP